MVELADTQDLGSCAKACGFKSHYPHHKRNLSCLNRQERFFIRLFVILKIRETQIEYTGKSDRDPQG